MRLSFSRIERLVICEGHPIASELCHEVVREMMTRAEDNGEILLMNAVVLSRIRVGIADKLKAILREVETAELHTG